MISVAVAFALAVGPKEPRLRMEIFVSSFNQTAERRAIRDELQRATANHDWSTAYSAAQRALEDFPDPKKTQDAYGFQACEFLLLAGRADEAWNYAKPYLEPYVSKKGPVIHDLGEYLQYQKDRKDDPEVSQEIAASAGSWAGARQPALELAIQASLLLGRIKDAAKYRELIEADLDAWPAFCGTGQEFTIMDRRSQAIPLALAGKGDLKDLKWLAAFGYQPDPSLNIDRVEQKRLMAVFASMLLGHIYRSKGDAATARRYFADAKQYMEQKRVIVNREILQWHIASEELKRP
jgi:predicted amino acid-binding ACT domain protein